GQNQRISPCSTLTSSTASPPAGSPCSTLPTAMPGQAGHRDCAYGSVTSPTSTLESRDSGIIATLTSYSENMERGGKYSEGSRGNLKLWQSQKSGMDSFLYRVDENMTASTFSLNKIPERNLESMSSHSAHSIPLYLMPRPNSVAGESPSFPLLLLCKAHQRVCGKGFSEREFIALLVFCEKDHYRIDGFL
ncbi:Protein tanc2, partial [Xenotaenia resolanae]